MERGIDDLLHRGDDNDQKVRYRYRYNVGRLGHRNGMDGKNAKENSEGVSR
jgi:hypothetical protein